jgi:hypothetical protein
MLALEGMMNARFVIEQQSPPVAPPSHHTAAAGDGGGPSASASPNERAGSPLPARTVVFGISGSGCPTRRHQPERPGWDPIAIAMRGLRADGVAFVFAFLLAFFFAIYGHSEEMTPDEWFRLVIQLQGRSAHLDAEERDFVRNMINALTLSEDRMPKTASAGMVAAYSGPSAA